MASINMVFATRPAVYTPRIDKPNFGLTKGLPVNVEVFGLYQASDYDGTDAYFVIMLHDGRCTYAGVEDIRFTDVEGFK